MAEENDDDHWRGGWLGLYVNRENSRLWVPKKRPGVGWTLNLGHPRARWVLVGIGVVILAAAVLSSAVDPR